MDVSATASSEPKGNRIMTGTTSRDATAPTIVNPATLHDPTPNGYSAIVVAPAGCRLAFVSGLGGQGERGELSPAFGDQVAQAYRNLASALDALGAAPGRVVKLSVFVVDHDMSKLGVLTQAVTRMFGERPPAQTLVPLPALAVDAMLFEVEAVVALD